MNWFLRAVKAELERRNLKVTGIKYSKFMFITVNKKGKRWGIYCKPHGHVTGPLKKKLLYLGHQLGLDSVYVASEAYSEEATHKVKVIVL